MSLELSVVFYSDPMTKRAKLVQICQRHPVFHCGLMLTNEDRSLVVAADKTHRAKFIPADLYHERKIKPSHVIILGDTDDDNLRRLMDFIVVPYKGDSISMAFWFFVGRWLFKSYIPHSCSILASQMARFCGFEIADFVLPKDLFSNLAIDYKCLTWKEYVCR